MTFAIEDITGQMTHVAIYWNDDVEQWSMLAIGIDIRSQEEIDKRVGHWSGKGIEHIKVFELREVTADSR